MEKQEIRELIRRKRIDLSAEWIAEASDKIRDRVMEISWFREARNVGCYLSVAGEVGTAGLVAECRALEKTIMVPAWNEEKNRYSMTLLKGDMDLSGGRYGINEPSVKEWCSELDLDVLLVPGLAFDRKGWRVGHGGGCYDRLISIARGDGSKPGFKAVGLAFDFQVLSDVPFSEHDERVDFIVTKNELIETE